MKLIDTETCPICNRPEHNISHIIKFHQDVLVDGIGNCTRIKLRDLRENPLLFKYVEKALYPENAVKTLMKEKYKNISKDTNINSEE